MLQFDAPCSGVNMLWAALLLTLMGCVLLRFGMLKVAAAVALATVLSIGCNVLRASSLFYIEAGLVPHAPAWWHDGIGIAAFSLSAAVTLWVLRRCSPDGAFRAATPVFDGLWRHPGMPVPHFARAQCGLQAGAQ
jgi:exosortase/archaeosortase family protein